MKFLNIKSLYIPSLMVALLISCSLKSEDNSKIDLSLGEEKGEDNKGFQIQQDSLYRILLTKIDSDKDYAAVVKSLVDSVFVNYFDSMNCYDCLENELFIKFPKENIQKIDVGEFSVVIANLSIMKRRVYFLLDPDKKILDNREIPTYRNTIISQEVYDWNNDGSQDIVEKYKQQGQMFYTFTDVVFSVNNEKIDLVFSLDYKEIDCLANESKGTFIERDYKSVAPDLFLITERVGSCSCEDFENNNLSNNKITSKKTYEQTSKELLAKYGTLFSAN